MDGGNARFWQDETDPWHYAAHPSHASRRFSFLLDHFYDKGLGYRQKRRDPTVIDEGGAHHIGWFDGVFLYHIDVHVAWRHRFEQ